MDKACNMIIRLSPESSEIAVEQNVNGVMCRKTISPETLAQCVLGSRLDNEVRFSGVLPENCVSVSIAESFNVYYIRYPVLYADISYYGTTYENFPLPRMVFGFQYAKDNGKVTNARLCVVKDERLNAETPTFVYPFSNVCGDKRICLGNNALPAYKDPARIFTLANFILAMPNNNDMFNPKSNRSGLPYRELLEHLKDKEPSYYYSDVLIPDGKTLGNFMNGGY